MAFSIDTHNLPWIPNYEAAVKEFEKHTPIRGGDQSVRRIANRKDNTKLLIEEIRDGVRVYKARLWRTTLIGYYPTHYEISIGGWPTASTFKFLNTVSPSQVHTERDRGYVPQDFSVEESPKGYYYYAGVPVTSTQVFKFAYGTNKPLEPERHPEYRKYMINRKALNAVYKDYRPFMAYAKTMLGLMDTSSDDTFKTSDMFKALVRFNTTTAVVSGPQEDADLSTWFDIVQALVYSNRHIEWTPRRTWVCNESDIMRDLRRRIKSNNPQVLEVKEIIRAI